MASAGGLGSFSDPLFVWGRASDSVFSLGDSLSSVASQPCHPTSYFPTETYVSYFNILGVFPASEESASSSD